MNILLALLAGVVAALVGGFLAGAIGSAVGGAGSIGPDRGIAAGYAAVLLGLLGGGISFAVTVFWVLKVRGGGGVAAAGGQFVVAMIITGVVIVGGVAAYYFSTEPAVGNEITNIVFEIEGPSTMPAPRGPNGLTAELQYGAKARPDCYFSEEVQELANGRKVVKCYVVAGTAAWNRMLVLSLPNETRLFKIDLPFNHAWRGTTGFGSWKPAIAKDSPGQAQPMRTPDGDGYRVRYRVKLADGEGVF